jgi:hypothetical protein
MPPVVAVHVKLMSMMSPAAAANPTSPVPLATLAHAVTFSAALVDHAAHVSSVVWSTYRLNTRYVPSRSNMNGARLNVPSRAGLTLDADARSPSAGRVMSGLTLRSVAVPVAVPAPTAPTDPFKLNFVVLTYVICQSPLAATWSCPAIRTVSPSLNPCVPVVTSMGVASVDETIATGANFVTAGRVPFALYVVLMQPR